MLTHKRKVDGQDVEIHVAQTEDDLDMFSEFIASNINQLAVDSETTGLDIYSSSFKIRLVQFGHATEAWVVPVQLGGAFEDIVIWALLTVKKLVLQNAAYDLQVFDQTLGVKMEELWPKVRDTKILAHLIDPRPIKDGGVGHSLVDLTRAYVDAEIADDVKGLMKKLAHDAGCTVSVIWKKVALDDEDYNLYAGMDVILTSRLLNKLKPLVPADSQRLVGFEHEVAAVCSYMSRTGFLLDVTYSEKLSQKLKLQESRNSEIASNFGCDSVNSPAEIFKVLKDYKIPIPNQTPTGKPKIDDDLLGELAGQGNEFAKAVVEAKKAGKWRKTWVDRFIKTADKQSKCHASINPLAARTARMSITGIPAQTLPANDATIRNCFLAEPGHVIVSVDYQAQELRILAHLSGDRNMIRAFKDGEDLHLITARAAFGDYVQKEDPERQIGKVVNFARVYGGGAAVVSKQAGIDLVAAKTVVDGFDKAFPQVKEYSDALQKEGSSKGYITTPSGRRLPVDPTRAYAALNYIVQSTARDVTARALLRLHKAGITPYMRLPIHDEILLSVPTEKAPGAALKVAKIMTEHMGKVVVEAEGKVGGQSWGSLYKEEVEN
jgi:DNA polymerase-1